MSKLIKDQFSELVAVFSKLSLSPQQDGGFLVSGDLGFSSTVGGVTIQDRYRIEMLISQDYPNRPPVVKEVGRRIPKAFHVNPDGTLCLAAEIEVKRRFDKSQTLIHFVKDLVIPFFYQHSYFEKYGKMPFGELSHGAKGVLEHYVDYFGVDDELTALLLLKVIAEDNYRGHHMCPCGSGVIVRKCHGKQLLKLKSLQPHSYFLFEYVGCVMKDGENSVIHDSLKSKRVLCFMQKLINKKR